MTMLVTKNDVRTHMLVYSCPLPVLLCKVVACMWPMGRSSPTTSEPLGAVGTRHIFPQRCELPLLAGVRCVHIPEAVPRPGSCRGTRGSLVESLR